MSVNYIALAVPIFFVLIGIELVAARWRKVSVYRFDDSITDTACGTGQQIVGVFLKGLLFGGYAYLYEHYRLVTFADGSIVPWLIAFFGVDFAYYWWHRLSHEVAFMWAIHVVHHQSEDYNLAVALRQAWFSGLSSWVFYAPLAFLGVPVVPFVTIYAFSTLYQYWIHTRLLGTLGPIEWVFNTASHHRVHHGRDDKYLDRNYAATLIVWDRLFGSFQKEEEEPKYGVVHAYASWNPVWANFELWQQLWAKARGTPRLADKIRVYLKPPGWVPPGAEVVAHDVASEPRVRFETRTPSGLAWYVAAHFVPATAATVWLMSREPGSMTVVMAAVAVLVLVTTVAWGAMFERKAWGAGLELARLALIVAGAVWLYGVGSAPAGAVVAVGALAAVSAMWLWMVRPGRVELVAGGA